MTDVATLLAEFIDQLNAGAAPQVDDFLVRAESDEARVELATQIEVAIDFAPEEVRHPRADDGSFVLGLSAARIAEISGVSWPESIPAWRDAANLSVEQLAGRTLELGGIEPSPANLSVARRWIEAMESGAETVRTISSSARRAVADALGINHKRFDQSGSFEPRAAVAFRSRDADVAADASAGLVELAHEIDAAMPARRAGGEVDRWFTEGKG